MAVRAPPPRNVTANKNVPIVRVAPKKESGEKSLHSKWVRPVRWKTGTIHARKLPFEPVTMRGCADIAAPVPQSR
jgi:hypothetical protein